MYPGPGGYQGELVAWDVANAKKVWSVKRPICRSTAACWPPAASGVLRHHGRLVPSRRRADRQGTVADETGSGIVGNPMTFLGPDGKQYVAIYAGIGGWMGAVALPSVSTDDHYAALGVGWGDEGNQANDGARRVLYVFGY